MPQQSPPDTGSPHAIILFDGVCNLCNGAVRFILKRDRNGHFRFASLQGAAGRALLARFYPHPAGAPDSMVLIEGGRAYVHSDAVLRIARRLGSGWALLSAFRVIPRPVRDVLYRRVAAHRYRWFGKRDQCMIPSPDARSRFLDDA